MIQEIGVMIGLYIVTRMAALLGQPSEQANAIAKILAALTIVITVIFSGDLLVRGVNFPVK